MSGARMAAQHQNLLQWRGWYHFQNMFRSQRNAIYATVATHHTSFKFIFTTRVRLELVATVQNCNLWLVLRIGGRFHSNHPFCSLRNTVYAAISSCKSILPLVDAKPNLAIQKLRSERRNLISLRIHAKNS